MASREFDAVAFWFRPGREPVARVLVESDEHPDSPTTPAEPPDLPEPSMPHDVEERGLGGGTTERPPENER
jgi:hypothetical protein